jgi:type IV pilus assembly protein PilC
METTNTKIKKSWNINIEIGGIKPVDIMLFTKHLSVTLQSGLTLVDALEILVDQSKGKMQQVVEKLLDTVKSGEPFYEALKQQPKYFSAIYVNMVKSGELSGTLDQNLKKLTRQLEKSYALKKKIKSAMIYPIMIFVAVFALGVSVAIFILPKILPLFKTLDVELPLTTRGLIYVAETFEAHGLAIFIGLIVFMIFSFWLLKRDFVKPFTHRLVLKIPLVNKIIMNINLERFNHTFGSLLESGLPLNQSLKITADATDNRVYKKAVQNLVPVIEAGNPLSKAIASYPELFPLITSRMIGVGERTGNLGQNLKYLAQFYEEAVDEATKNLSTTLEPILLMVIGVIVGTVAISILGPIYQITGNLRQ